MPDLTLAAHRRYLLNQQRILHDTHLSAELKIIGLLLRRSIDLSQPVMPSPQMATLVFPDVNTAHAYTSFQRLMRHDIRRYDPYQDRASGRCQEMLPRAQRPCGKSGSLSGYITDLNTGEKTFRGWCAKHAGIGARVMAQNREDLKTRIVPRPYANTGGALRAHLPELGWAEYWKKLDPTWEPFPEREPVIETVPTLSLVPLHEEAPAAKVTARALHPARGRRLRVVRGVTDDE